MNFAEEQRFDPNLEFLLAESRSTNYRPKPDCLDATTLKSFAEFPSGATQEQIEHISSCGFCRRRIGAINQWHLPELAVDEIPAVLSAVSAENTDSQVQMDQLGAILRWIADSIQPRPDRRTIFREAIRRGLSLIQQIENCEEKLIQQADQNEWPRWAVESLPSLLVFESTGGLVWEPIASSLPQFTFDVVRELAGGVVQKLSVISNAHEELRVVGERFEAARRNILGPSSRSMECLISELMSELARDAHDRGDEELGGQIERRKNKRLQDLGLAVVI